MQRSRVVAALLAILAVAAIGVAAATLGETGGGTGGFGTGDTEGAGAGTSPFAIDLSADDPVDGSPPGWLVEWVGRLVLLAMLAGSAYALLQFYRSHGFRGIATVTAAGVALLLVLFALFDAVGGSDGPSRPGGAANETSLVPSGGVPGGGDAAVPAAEPPTVLAILFVLALAGAGLVLVRATGDDEFSPEPERLPDDGGDVDAVGRVAGEAADRIARGAIADNEVHRAWRAMTEHLDVANPQASTPGEFADAAVDAGMAETDVERLTDLFEAVRYGDAAPTDRRERAAVEALRNIEAEYA